MYLEEMLIDRVDSFKGIKYNLLSNYQTKLRDHIKNIGFQTADINSQRS